MTTVYTNAVQAYTLPPLLSPAPLTDPANLLVLQSPVTSPTSDTLVTGTNYLNLPPDIMTRLRSFPEEVYTLLPTDNLVKLIKVMLGDAGSGQLRKSSNMARLGTVLQGANFYDLDSFYGALFGIIRNTDEQLPVNPYIDLATADTWSTVRGKDASFRSRIDQLGKAISFGPSAIGMELISEAILQTPCTVYESWRAADAGIGTWADLETLTWAELEAYTWTELESLSEDPDSGSVNRKVFTVVPHRAISLEEDFALRRVLNVIKPVDSVLLIDDAGFASSTPVTLRGVYADSEYWELVESVIPNPAYASLYTLSGTPDANGFEELLRPAGTQYQGEEVNYGSDIVGVSAYDQNDLGQITSNQVIDAYTFADGVTLYYPPGQGIATRFFSLSGRLVSDAILQGAPFSNDPNNTSSTTTNPLMDLYVDGMPIENLIAGISTPGSVSALGINASDQRFWSTPPRLGDDDTTEVLDIHLIASRLVNTLTFQAAHYPQSIQVQTYNPTNATWNTIWTQSIYDSVPSVLPIAPPLAHEHPQHPSSNWDTFTISIPPTNMSEIRILLQRIPSAKAPVSAQISPSPSIGGAPSTISVQVPYSLGIQNFALGYTVAQESDLPPVPLITRDALSSQIEWTTRYEVADNAIDGSDVPWRSAPQPTADSVVNFYVDTRDITGAAQIICEFFIDPLYLGPHCTLYFSDDDPNSLSFPAEATDIVPPSLETSGVVVPYDNGLVFDSLSPAQVLINNLAVQFNPAVDWWTSVSFQPNFPSFDVPGDTCSILDYGSGDDEHFAMILYLEDNVVGVFCGDGGNMEVPLTWATGQTVYATIAYFSEPTAEFNAGLYLFASTNNPDNSFDPALLSEGHMVQPIDFPVFASRYSTNGTSAYLPPFDMGPQPEYLAFGNAQYVEPFLTDGNLLTLVLKQDAMSYTDLANFKSNTSSYTTVSGDMTANAILRLNSQNISDTNALGFIGGPGDFYEYLTWNPIMRDYILSKGYMEIPPTSAKFFKFEFTNLIAEPFPTLLPITKTAQTHSGLGTATVQAPVIPPLNNPGTSIQGTQSAIELASTINFSDAQVITNPLNTEINPTVPQPTLVQTAPDIQTQAVLANSAWYWQYQTWAVGQTAPRFVNVSTHSYNQNDVVQNTQVSYFVGLNSIAAYRLNPNAQDDTEVYDEIFYDDTYIATTQLNQNPGDVNTVGQSGFPLYDQSDIYNSTTPVYGVHFASVQSDPVNISYDDDFGDPAIAPPYDWSGTTTYRSNTFPYDIITVQQPSSVGDALVQLQVNQTVLVSRDTVNPPPPAPTFDGIVDPIVYPVFDENLSIVEPETLTSDIDTYRSQPGNEAPGYLGGGLDFGGLASAQSDTADGGTVWAAVRLTTNDILTTPLYLEIYDLDSNRVVASLPVNCSPNQTVEVYVGYILGSVVTAGGPIVARIVQYGGADNTWVVDRLSLFEESWEWEFSNDGGSTWVTEFNTRNNAYGIITFPAPGDQLVWRVTAWAPDLHLHYLRIRPVYNGVISNQPIGIVQGPNYSVFDQVPPLEQDPFFTGWTKPIPYSWFQAAQTYPEIPIPGQASPGPYSRFYSRNITDDVSGITEQAVRTLRAYRDVPETHTTEDVLERYLGVERDLSDSTTVTTSATPYPTDIAPEGPIVDPPVSDLPNEG